MIVTNATWQRAGAVEPAKLVVQNVDTARIAYVFAAAQPGAGSITLDSDEHFVLAPGSPQLAILGLNTDAKSMWVRALGPRSANLAVDG